jgi:hypothetical protein
VLISVEPKAKMKGRIGFSPDLADSALILLDLCRVRFGFTPGNGVQKLQTKGSWIERANQAHSVYEPQYAYRDSPFNHA